MLDQDNRIMEWARKIVNTIMRKNKDSKFLYSVRFTIEPNPLNFDGVDKVVAQIIQKNQYTKFTRTYFLNSDHCFNINDAISEINSFILEPENDREKQ